MTSADALADDVPIPAPAVLLGERDQSAVGRGAGRTSGIGQQHERQQPRDLAVVGQQAVEVAAKPDRLGRQVGALQVGTGARRVALVEDQVQDVQDDPQAAPPARPPAACGSRPPADLMVCFARLIRWAIVASGTRNARAICAVVRPPTARSVSATCEAGESAGWQHRNRSVSVSSSSDDRVRLGRQGLQRLGREQGRCLRLALAPRRVAADLVGQAAGRDRDQPAPRVVRQALLGPLERGGQERLLDRVLAVVELAVAPDQRAEDLRRELAKQALDALERRHISRPERSISGRTSTMSYSATGARPRWPARCSRRRGPRRRPTAPWPR